MRISVILGFRVPAPACARHLNGECFLFADVVTDSIQALINITEYRRAGQIATLKNATPVMPPQKKVKYPGKKKAKKG